MILDKLENLHLYAGLNSNINKVVEFIATHDLKAMPQGRVEICGKDCFANFDMAHGRSREEALLESHNRMIDIQLILDGQEDIGWSPRSEISEAPYNNESDFSLYKDDRPRDYFTLREGEFMLFLPADAHAPLISPVESYRKVIFKLKVE